jgi:hypothetical protein
MHRYLAPENTTGVFVSTSGELRVRADGHVHLADDAPSHDHDALRAAGFVLAAASAPKAKPDSAAKPKAKRGSSKKGSAAKKPAAAPAAPAPAEPAVQPEGGAAE